MKFFTLDIGQPDDGEDICNLFVAIGRQDLITLYSRYIIKRTDHIVKRIAFFLPSKVKKYVFSSYMLAYTVYTLGPPLSKITVL